MLTAREPSVKPLATATTAASGGAEKFPMEDEALRNAKASPFGRGVCEADGEGKDADKKLKAQRHYRSDKTLAYHAAAALGPQACPLSHLR